MTTLALLSGCSGGASRPNVIIIDLDTFRGDRVGLYETLRRGTQNPAARTPNLDGLAKNGYYFPNAFAQAPRTLPSQMSIMTSRYPSSHGVGTKARVLPDSAQTLARAFHDAGYETCAFVDGGWVRKKFGFGVGFESFDESGGALAQIVPRALGWLESRRDDRPFLLWLHAYDTHSPYDPKCAGVDRRPTGIRFARDPAYDGRLRPREITGIMRQEASWSEIPDSICALVAASYDHAVGCADGWVGELLSGLERLHLTDRTIIACVSDHGEAFREHGFFFHASLHHEILRVPFFIVVPARDGKGVTDERLVETIDLAPTLLDLAGIQIPVEFEGQSLTRGRALRSLSDWPAKPCFAVGSKKKEGDTWWSITTESHHLIRSVVSGELELYAWRDDPRETTEISARARDVVADLEAQLLEWAVRTSASVDAGFDPEREVDLTEEETEELRALGYVQ